jgi:hypothetical protein
MVSFYVANACRHTLLKSHRKNLGFSLLNAQAFDEGAIATSVKVLLYLARTRPLRLFPRVPARIVVRIESGKTHGNLQMKRGHL